MKIILIPAFSALLMGQSLSLAADPAAKESVSQELHNFWVKTKAYLSDDWGTFKEGAQITLDDLSKQVDAVAAKAGTTTPGYFQLRLQALKEQRDYLKIKMGELDSESIKVHLSGPRYVFDQGVSALEAAITQANNEADSLAKLNVSETKDPS